jgi:hypothetical protein
MWERFLYAAKCGAISARRLRPPQACADEAGSAEVIAAKCHHDRRFAYRIVRARRHRGSDCQRCNAPIAAGPIAEGAAPAGLPRLVREPHAGNN